MRIRHFALVTALLLATGASGMWLWKRTQAWDLLASSAVELAVVFTAATLVTGSIWGGAAWGTVKDTYVAQGFANPTIFRGALQPGPFLAGGGTFSHTRTGWTVGGGVETKLFRGWTAKLEYLHVDLGGRTETFAVPINAAFGAAFNTGGSAGVTTRTKVTDNVIRVGLNYKIF